MSLNEIELKELNFDLTNAISSKLSGLKGKYNILIKVTPSNQLNVVLNLINLFSFLGKKDGILVLLKKDAKSFVEMLELIIPDIKLERLYFIDCVSNVINPSLHLQGSSIEDLNQLTVSVELLLRKQPEIDFLLFDLLNPILLYNDEKTFQRFIRFFLQKLELHNVRGLFLAVETEKNKQILSELSVFFDKTIELRF